MLASIRYRNRMNSWSRCRGIQSAITEPSSRLRAAKGVVV